VPDILYDLLNKPKDFLFTKQLYKYSFTSPYHLRRLCRCRRQIRCVHLHSINMVQIVSSTKHYLLLFDWIVLSFWHYQRLSVSWTEHLFLYSVNIIQRRKGCAVYQLVWHFIVHVWMNESDDLISFIMYRAYFSSIIQDQISPKLSRMRRISAGEKNEISDTRKRTLPWCSALSKT